MSDPDPAARLQQIRERLTAVASYEGCQGSCESDEWKPCNEQGKEPEYWCAFCLMAEAAKELAAVDQARQKAESECKKLRRQLEQERRLSDIIERDIERQAGLRE